MPSNQIRLPQFLKSVDALTEKLTKEELEAAVREIARILPESQRGVFEAKLKAAQNRPEESNAGNDGFGNRKFGNNAGNGAFGNKIFENEKSGKTESGNTIKNEEEIQMVQKIQTILAKLAKIQVGEDCLDSEYNEAWDDWYSRSDEEFCFSDPNHILEGVRQAIQMVHTCIDHEFMDSSVMELIEQLSLLEISVTGDYQDCDGSPLSLQDLYLYDLLKGDYDELIRECLYLNYIGSKPEERAERLYDMIETMDGNENIQIESLMQMGSTELPGFDDFLKSWISLLGSQTDERASRLLNEAQQLLCDDTAMLENARRYAKDHPSLFLQYLELEEERRNTGITAKEGEADREQPQGEAGHQLRRSEAGHQLPQSEAGQKQAETLLAIGREALKQIPADYKIRSLIALRTASYANRLRDVQTAEQCWLEAFLSDPSVVNYMRLRLETRNWKQYQDVVWTIIEAEFEKSKQKKDRFVTGECQRNELSRYDYCNLLFFEQDFELMRKTGMSTGAALGWSATFMKQGIALMLLLLYQGDTLLPKGLQEMQNDVILNCKFMAEKYTQGLEMTEGNDSQLFSMLFAEWKEQVILTEADQKQWLKRIDAWLLKRVEGIMQENRRNYYGECAAFLAALCEVMQSRGEPGAKEAYYERYRKLYPRRRAFLEAMRSYGMK